MIHSFPTRGQTIHLYLSKLEIRSQKFFNSHTKRRRQKKRQDKLFSIEKNRIPRQCILRNKRWAARDVRMKIKTLHYASGGRFGLSPRVRKNGSTSL